ncbi:MAG: hypothetical protein Roseis2KO_39260 [Roseivirga sp.]
MKSKILISSFLVLATLQVLAQNKFNGASDTGLDQLAHGNGINAVLQHIIGPNDKNYILYHLDNEVLLANSLDSDIPVSRENTGTLAYAVVVLDADRSLSHYFKIETEGGGVPHMAVNSLGEVFIASYFGDKIYLDPSAPTTPTYGISASQSSIALAKYSTTGNLDYSQRVGRSNGIISFLDVQIHLVNDTDFVLSTKFSGTADMSENASNPQSFLASTTSAFFFLYRNGGQFDTGFSIGRATFEGIETSSTGDLYAFGYTDARVTVDLDGSTNVQSVVSASKSRNFMVRYDNTLAYQGHIDFGEGSISGKRRLAIDSYDSVIIASNPVYESLFPDATRDRLDLDPSANTFDAVTTQQGGIFMAKYGADLAFGDAYVFGGEQGSLSTVNLMANNQRIVLALTNLTSGVNGMNIGPRNGASVVITSNSTSDQFTAGLYSIDRDNEFAGFERISSQIGLAALNSADEFFYHTAIASGQDLDNGSANTASPSSGLFLVKMDACTSTTTTSTPAVCFGDSYDIGLNSYDTDGTYIDILEDVNGCDSLVVSTLIFPTAALTATIRNTSNATCLGNNDGFIDFGITGGTAPYTVSLDGTTFLALDANTNLTGLGPTNVSSVIVKDANDCEFTINSAVNISAPPGVTILGLLVTPPTCSNGSDGTFTLTATSNSLPMLYSIDGGNTFQPSGTFQNLSGGTYTVIAKDDNGCTNSQTVNMIPPPSVVLVGTTVDLSCNGAGDGQIDLSTSSGGTGTLEYSIDGGSTYQASGLFTGLAAGTYALSVRDENGCTKTSNATLTEPTAIIASIDNIQTVSCNGADDGVVTLDVSGGTGPYQISADGINFQALPTNGQITGIGPVSIQNLTVKDANECEVVIAGFTMTEPDAVTITNPVVDNVSCDGAADGNIDLTGAVTGGTGAYTYSIDGNNFQSNPVFSSLNPGSYTITTMDANNCTGTLNVVITEPDALKVNPDQADVTCNGADNGVILVNADGGTAPYEYSLDGTTFSATDFPDLAAGNYTLTVRDANGCTDMTMVTITEPDALALSVTGTSDVTCGNDADGTVSVSLSGGTAPYTYSLDGTNFGDDSALAGLLKGDYTLTIRDANDCSISTMFTIDGPDAIAATTKGGDVSCNGGADGSLTVTAMGGNGGFTYSLDGTNFVTDPVFSGLVAGMYTVVVKDQNDCRITVTHTINEPSALVLQFESVDISCNGEVDGQIAGFASGGTAPYQYSLDGTTFQTGAFQNLSAGTYTLTVKDDNDCTTTATVTISEPDVLMASATTTTVDCNGNSTGTATLSVTGGSTPYRYSLDGTTFNNAIDLSALAAGMYTVAVQDANNCETSVSFTIEEPEALMLSVTDIKDISCNGADDGSITVAATGGTGPYAYRLSDTGFITGDTFENLAPGTYTIRVKDANDCFVEVSATIAEPTAITATAAVTDILCNGDATGSIALTATGGTGSLQYSLDGTNFQTEASFTALTAGDYTVTVRDANSCNMTVNATVAQPDAISATLSISDVACNGEANGEISVTATGGTGALEYAIDGTNFQSTSAFTALSAGNYTITIRDENSCTLTLDATVSEPDMLAITATLTGINTITATATGGATPYEYSIDGTNFQSGATFSRLSNGNYTITVRDANGCTANLTQSIIVTSSDDDFIPTVIEAYPNPVTDYVMISRVNAGDVIMMADLKSSVVNATTIEQTQDKYRHDVSGLNQGVFVLVIKDAEGRVKHRSKIMKVE